MKRKENHCNCELCGEESNSRKEKPLKVRFCPKCKNTEVKFIFELKNLFGLIPRIECSKCGYSSIDFPILIVNKKNINKKTKTKRSKK